MSYQIEYQEKVGYLYAHIQLKRTLDAVIASTKIIAEKAIALGQKRILIDVREFEGLLQIMESNYVVTTEFPKLRGTGILRVAILDRVLAEPNRWAFFETVARNRGYDIRVTSDPQFALDWLLENVDLEK